MVHAGAHCSSAVGWFWWGFWCSLPRGLSLLLCLRYSARALPRLRSEKICVTIQISQRLAVQRQRLAGSRVGDHQLSRRS